MLLSWWCPFKIQKEEWQGLQFTTTDYLSIISISLRFAGQYLKGKCIRNTCTRLYKPQRLSQTSWIRLKGYSRPFGECPKSSKGLRSNAYVHCNDVTLPRYKLGTAATHNWDNVMPCHPASWWGTDRKSADEWPGSQTKASTQDTAGWVAAFQDSQGTKRAYFTETAELV
jgi:hypothetical protein